MAAALLAGCVSGAADTADEDPVSVQQPLVAGTEGGPAFASWGPGRLDIFVRNLNNTITHRQQGVHDRILPGIVTSAPAAVSPAPNRIELAARGPNNETLIRSYNNGSWGDWVSVGGIATSGPALASMNPDRLDVFVRATDNSLYTRTRLYGQWGAWQGLGGILTSEPAAVSWGNGRIDVFVRSTERTLVQRSFENGAWSAWKDWGMFMGSGAGLCSWGPGRLDVFMKSPPRDPATPGYIHHGYFDNGQWRFLDFPLGTSDGDANGITSTPTCVSTGGVGTLVVGARASSGGLKLTRFSRWTSPTWQPWTTVNDLQMH